jgi:hypothetical protein
MLKIGFQKVLETRNIQTLKFHSKIEHTWLGKWLTAPKGFGKFYRKPGEKPPSGEKSSNSNTSSGAKQKEKVNMKKDSTGNKQGKNGGSGGDASAPKNLFVGIALGAALIYVIENSKSK